MIQMCISAIIIKYVNNFIVLTTRVRLILSKIISVSFHMKAAQTVQVGSYN